MEVVDEPLIGIPGTPEVLLVLSHFCAEEAVANGSLRDV
jgi:hypothetical protein